MEIWRAASEGGVIFKERKLGGFGRRWRRCRIGIGEMIKKEAVCGVVSYDYKIFGVVQVYPEDSLPLYKSFDK